MRMDGVGNVEGIQAAEKYEVSRWKISIGFRGGNWHAVCRGPKGLEMSAKWEVAK